MNKTTIRMMNDNDPERISEAFRIQGWDKPTDQYVKYEEEQKNGKIVSLIAEVEGDFAGYVNIAWESNYPYFKENNIPEIQDFNVLIKYRRHGIGTMLMDKCEEIIGERFEISGLGVGLFGDYGAAQSLYVHRGYVPDSKGIYKHGGYIQYGQEVVVDDDLNMYFVKKLR
ncbi:GNAT family N-acetyltransferase [Paenibacillus helianthi]|uniref:GNAT family N-acetyltransferase n=1 Tax=Paenibacillus helianthi TaxID=1349432 RepID=A0ABX3EG76_9BACL|nr:MULTISPECIES: GNAT family N-acetyltransferase [Paenibacillus]OKP79948.1 GNAT family N-acetyltransferase [Paenibacillus helianthi]OKP84946.1 GNAT family N-acetyltransferase [Paenibacillus sp. P32E]